MTSDKKDRKRLQSRSERKAAKQARKIRQHDHDFITRALGAVDYRRAA